MANYGRSWSDLRRFFAGLLLYKGLRIHYLSLSDRVAVATSMREYGLDFDDALAYQAMKSHDVREIVSYDEHFDKLSVVKRVTAQELL
jgi:predicted nucleic acid-binding protein